MNINSHYWVCTYISIIWTLGLEILLIKSPELQTQFWAQLSILYSICELCQLCDRYVALTDGRITWSFSCFQSGFVSIKCEAVMHPIIEHSNSRKNQLWILRHNTVGLKLEKPPSQYPVTLILGSPPQIRHPLIKLRRFGCETPSPRYFHSRCRNIQHRTWWRSFQPTILVMNWARGCGYVCRLRFWPVCNTQKNE